MICGTCLQTHPPLVAGYALSWVIHCIQSEMLFWKPWLVYEMNRYGWPSVSGFSFGPETPSPFFELFIGCRLRKYIVMDHLQDMKMPSPWLSSEEVTDNKQETRMPCLGSLVRDDKQEKESAVPWIQSCESTRQTFSSISGPRFS